MKEAVKQWTASFLYRNKNLKDSNPTRIESDPSLVSGVTDSPLERLCKNTPPQVL